MTLVYCIVLHCAHPLVGSVSGTLPGGPVKGEGACMTCPEPYTDHTATWVLVGAIVLLILVCGSIYARSRNANLN